MEEEERLIKIDEMLRHEPHPNLHDLVRECCGSGNSTATVVRDLEKLKNVLGRKIIYDHHNGCYRYEEEYPCLSPSAFEADN